MYKIVGFLCLVSVALGQIHLEGTCQFNWVQPVEISKLTGEWKQLKRINEVNTVDGDCLSLNFVFNLTSGEADIYTTSVSNKKQVSRNATIVIKDAVKGILHITYTDGIAYDMVIQKTDYINYVILHGCNEGANNTKSVYGQVYTRKAEVTNVTLATIEEALNVNTDFAKANWTQASHSNEACVTDNGINLRISSFLLLIVGLVLAKDI